MGLAWGGNSGVKWAIRKSESLKKAAKDAVMGLFDRGELRDAHNNVVSSRRVAEEVAEMQEKR